MNISRHDLLLPTQVGAGCRTKKVLRRLMWNCRFELFAATQKMEDFQQLIMGITESSSSCPIASAW